MALAGLGLRMDRNVGGIDYFLIAPFSAVKVIGDASTGLATVTLADGTTITKSNNPYKKYIPSTGTATSSPVETPSNGTLFYEQIVTAVFDNLSKDNYAEYNTLARISTSIIAVYCDGMAIILGANCGCDINFGERVVPGRFTVSFIAKEPQDKFIIKNELLMKKEVINTSVDNDLFKNKQAYYHPHDTNSLTQSDNLSLGKLFVGLIKYVLTVMLTFIILFMAHPLYTYIWELPIYSIFKIGLTILEVGVIYKIMVSLIRWTFNINK